MLRFRLFGIPFAVAPFFWIFSALLGASEMNGPNGLLLLVVWVACVFVSIVVHELGHALMARRYGLHPAISLAGLGGLTSYLGGGLSRAQQIAISLAGPAAGFALYLAVRVLSRRLGMVGVFDAETTGTLLATEAVANLIFINLWWTLYNLLPILPLDGGQVLRDVLGPRLLPTARLIGAVCGAAVAIYAVTQRQLYMAMLFGYLAYANFQGNTRTLPGGVSRTGGHGEY